MSVWTHVVENVHPALHGDALEDGENGKQDVVEVGDGWMSWCDHY